MALFTNMSSILQSGFNVLGGQVGWFGEKVAYATEYWRGRLFPAPQKTEIRPSIVSNQPYTTLAGYRPVQPQAITLGSRFKSWWTNSWQNAVNSVSSFKNSIMGTPMEKIKRQNLAVVASTFSNIFQAGLGNLADRFYEKWGLVPRADSGDRIGNTPVREHDYIVYPNITQSKAPATQGVMGDFWDLMGLGTQPKGTYSLGYPQSEPYPVVVPTGVGEGVGKTNLMPLIIFGAIGLGIFFFLKRGK